MVREYGYWTVAAASALFWVMASLLMAGLPGLLGLMKDIAGCLLDNDSQVQSTDTAGCPLIEIGIQLILGSEGRT